jgi:tetratricopeptide (TPR) repeat protein
MTVALLFALTGPSAFPQASSTTNNALSSAKLQFERGKQLLEKGEFARAAMEFSEALKAVPNSPLLYNLVGFCQLQQGNKDEAVAHFKKAIALKPDFKPARNNLGGVYLMQGRNLEAINEFSAVVQSDPKDAQAFYNLARAELAANQKETGLEHLRKAYDLAPGNVPITLALAHLYLERGEKALGQPFAHKLAGVTVPDGATDLELGNLLLDYEMEEAATKHFRSALKANPKAQEIVYALATAQFKKQNYKATLGLLECVRSSMQNSAAWHEMVGYSSFKLGDPGQGTVELQKAMDLDPKNEDYVLELSEVFVTHNNAPAAITLLETASKVFAQSARIWFGLGTAYLADEKRSAAETALKRCLELDPKLDLAYVVLGQGYKEAGNWDQLQETAQRLIELNPKSSTGYYYKALALQSVSTSKAVDDADVEKLLRKSLELNHSDPEPHYELAKLLARQGKKEDSLLEFERIVQSRPDFGPAYYQLARLYRERGELEKSNEAQKAHERIRQKERDKVMRRLLVEVRKER